MTEVTSPPVGGPRVGNEGSEPDQALPKGISKFWSFLEGGNPHTNFWLILGSTLALSAIGLTMVLSSTSVEASGQPFTTASRQAAWAAVGLIGLLVMSYVPRAWMGSIGWVMMILASILLALVAFTPLGVEVNGSTNWLRIGPVQGQPSEIAKLALVLWGSAVLARKGALLSQFSHWMIPFMVPGVLGVLGLILLGGDLGTSVVLTVIAGALLFVSGVKLRYFAAAAGVAIMGIILLMLVTPYRMSRVYSWLGTNCDAAGDPCMQSTQGYYALASGGFWGVGLGQSRQKWSYIPEVENDFIFTIIGEELGLLGTLLVLALFALLVLGAFRVASASATRFEKLTCLGIITWLVGQSFINIAMVTGVIPVVGVPLPFISYGGSALTCALLAVGVLLNFARRQTREVADAPLN